MHLTRVSCDHCGLEGTRIVTSLGSVNSVDAIVFVATCKFTGAANDGGLRQCPHFSALMPEPIVVEAEAGAPR